MAFLTIEIQTKPSDPELGSGLADYVFPEARRHSLLRALQAYISNELKRDFAKMKVSLVEHERGSLLTAECADPLSGRKLTKQERAFLDQIAGMLAPDYMIADDGGVSKTDGTPISGLAIDWRGVMVAVAQQGPTFLAGLVETVRDGAAKILAQEETPDA